MILVSSGILLFISCLDSLYAQKNHNIEDNDYDYIFDPRNYFETEGIEQEKNDDSKTLKNHGNLAQELEPKENHANYDNIEMINETSSKQKIVNTYDDPLYDDDNNLNLKDKAVVKTRINLVSIEKKGFLSIVAFINGQEVLKNVTLDGLNPSKQLLVVNLAVNKETDIVRAGHPDEFFVCAYHVKDLSQELNSLTYFDCDEGDLSEPGPTTSRLFSPGSLVYSKSLNLFNNSTDKYSQFLSTNNDYNGIQQEDQREENDKVIIKVFSPLEDRTDTQKLKMVAMVKGQMKSIVIDNVQAEFKKNGTYTISRTFTFDRNTNIGKIQIGDKFFACVSSNDLRPPEGTECEKRLITKFGKPNALYAR